MKAACLTLVGLTAIAVPIAALGTATFGPAFLVGWAVASVLVAVLHAIARRALGGAA